jgi:dihydroorotase
VTSYLIKGARIVGGEPADLLVRDGVLALGEADASAEVLDATGLVALPGLVDLHTHLREPGREDAETVLTGTQAAAMGGFTAVHAMANTDPVADTAGVVEQVWRLGREGGYCDVYPVGAVTVGLAGQQLAELGAMADSAARVRVFSDDGHCVSDAVLMRRALEYVKAFDGVVAQHAQEARLTEDAQMNEGELSGRLGLAGWPAVAEEAVIARDCLLAAHVGSRLHVCHVSTAGSVELIRQAKASGWNVTAEVTPHHLLLSDELAASYDPVYKVNPPLRTAADTEALRAGLADGTIDVVATDHAPHPLEDKDCEWAAAAFGMLGLETALSVVQETMVDPGLLTWAEVADRMSYAPARIGRVGDHGRPLEDGAPANVVLYDPSVRRVVEASEPRPSDGPRRQAGLTAHAAPLLNDPLLLLPGDAACSSGGPVGLAAHEGRTRQPQHDARRPPRGRPRLVHRQPGASADPRGDVLSGVVRGDRGDPGGGPRLFHRLAGRRRRTPHGRAWERGRRGPRASRRAWRRRQRTGLAFAPRPHRLLRNGEPTPRRAAPAPRCGGSAGHARAEWRLAPPEVRGDPPSRRPAPRRRLRRRHGPGPQPP